MENQKPRRSAVPNQRALSPNANYTKLEQMHETLRNKHSRLVKDHNALKLKFEKKQADLTRTETVLEDVVSQKHDLAQALSESKAYARKLEAKLTLGRKEEGHRTNS